LLTCGDYSVVPLRVQDVDCICVPCRGDDDREFSCHSLLEPNCSSCVLLTRCIASQRISPRSKSVKKVRHRQRLYHFCGVGKGTCFTLGNMAWGFHFNRNTISANGVKMSDAVVWFKKNILISYGRTYAV
jgi:hypothetical protein